MNSDLRRRLKALADDMKGPLGTIPLDRALRRHLDLFEELRREGATWPQISQALAAAGVRRGDGRIVSADHLRGAVSRQIKWRPPNPTERTPKGRIVQSLEQQRASPKICAAETLASAAPKAAPIKSAATWEPDRKPTDARSLQEKLSRVAKLRGD